MPNLASWFRILTSCRWNIAIPIALIPLLIGCPSRPQPTRNSTSHTDQEDALAAVRDTVRKEHKADTFKTAVAQLNVYLGRPTDAKPAIASPSERDLLANKLHLSADELKEVLREDFSPLDVHYLDECFLFHDAARGLKLDFAQKSDAAQLERGRLCFAWAMRQVWLNDKPSRPLPPSYALRMGFGNLAERTGVALAILQVIGIDAGVVGIAKDRTTLEPWCLAMRIGNEIYLLDPRGGKPVPGEGGKGIATLRQVRKNPALAQAYVQANVSNNDVASTVANSKVWLSPPLSSLSPRMRWLQSVLPVNPPVALGADVLSDIDEFAKAGETIDFWNPEGDITSMTRRLSHFVRQSDGGFEPNPPGQRLIDSYLSSLVPFAQMPALLRGNVVTGDPANRLRGIFSQRFLKFQLEVDQPRDQVLRGHFDDANRALVELLSEIKTVQRHIAGETDLDQGALKWAEDWRHAASQVERLKRDKRSEQEIHEATSRVAALEKAADKMMLVIERSASEPFAGMITFQLALCKHEQAERVARTRRDEADVIRDAWQNSAGWWRNYLGRFGTAGWIQPGQINHAKKLLAEVESEIAKLPAAKSNP